MNYKKIGFIGFGLIGGSIAKTLKSKNNDIEIIAKIRSRDTIKAAYEDGVISNNTIPDISEFVDCDLIFLCAPVKTNAEYLAQLKPIISDKTIITDVGSVKGDIEKAVADNGLEARFIGGHPMAGSEKIGYENATTQLLENAYYLVTKNSSIDEASFKEFVELVKLIGALPLVMSPEEHDYVTGGISHLPHIVSASLVNFVMNNDKDSNMKTVAAGGFRDITRISSSSPVMWQNICLTNKDKILELLEMYEKELDKFRQSITSNNADDILELFSEAKEYRDSLNTGKGLIEKVYDFYCDLADEAGGIATLATILAANQLNIKNIGIINNREFQDGVLRIEMYNEDAMDKAISILERNHYKIYK